MHLLLSRLQFAFTVAFHFIFPPSRSASPRTSRCWRCCGCGPATSSSHLWPASGSRSSPSRFAMGVVSGIVMSLPVRHQLEPLLGRRRQHRRRRCIGYEVLTAFFLEAAFLGVMLFGWNRVPQWLYVTRRSWSRIGTLVSAFWILSPTAGCRRRSATSWSTASPLPTDWLAILCNPSLPVPLPAHGDGGLPDDRVYRRRRRGVRYLRHGRFVERSAETMIAMGVGLVACWSPRSSVSATRTASTRSNTSRRSSPRSRAFGTAQGSRAVLFALPDETDEANRIEVAIPGVASLISPTTGTASFAG